MFSIFLFIAALAIAGVVALPADISKRSTPNGQGTSGGFFYQFWSEGGGSVTYTNGNAGEYSATWSSVQDFTAGKGWSAGANRNISFSGGWSGGGYLSVYTWSNSVETYILEDYSYNPGSSSSFTHMGTVTTDGATYDIYKDYPGTNPSDANFVQYWSIRAAGSKRTSGTVTTGDHYNAWNALGMTFNPANSYQIVSTEGFGSSGSADITVSLADGTTSLAASSVAPVNSSSKSAVSPTSSSAANSSNSTSSVASHPTSSAVSSAVRPITTSSAALASAVPTTGCGITYVTVTAA